MKKKLINKGLVCGIIVLFVGASVIPGISGNIQSKTVKSETSQIDINEPGPVASPKGVSRTDTDVKAVDMPEVQKEKISETFASTPLFFTENKGQLPEEVVFQTQVSGATVFLCKDKSLRKLPCKYLQSQRRP